jgi:hypothetical protein
MVAAMTIIPVLGLVVLCSLARALAITPLVGVSFCCPEGERLVVKGDRAPECVVADWLTIKSLEGEEVWTGGDDGEKRALKKLEVKTPTCRRGLKMKTVRINSTESQVFSLLLSTATPPPLQEPRSIPLFVSRNIELGGGRSDSEGNVYVNINGRMQPVCDDAWADVDAGVACRYPPSPPLLPARMLGYAGGSATIESRFGQTAGGHFGMDNVNCQVSAISWHGPTGIYRRGMRRACWTAPSPARMIVGQRRLPG